LEAFPASTPAAPRKYHPNPRNPHERNAPCSDTGDGFRNRPLIIEVMSRESERIINPVMIAGHSNAAFLEQQGRKHNRILLINLSICYFPSDGIYVIVKIR